MKIRLVRAIIIFLKDYFRQKKFLEGYLFPLLASNGMETDVSLSEPDLNKVKKIYSLISVILFVEPFQRLRGYKLSDQQRRCFSIIGALTSLVDDYFDRFQLDFAKILKIANNERGYVAENQHQSLTKKLLTELELISKPDDDYKETLSKVLYYQKESLKQFDSHTMLDDIYFITIQKSGSSALYYCTLVSPDISKEETEMLYHLTILIQTVNDIFDVVKDLNDGIKTYPNTVGSVGAIKKMFVDHIQNWKEALDKLPYSNHDKQVYFDRINLLLISITWVCLKQYEDLENENGHFNVQLYTRKQLICDKEKIKNCWNWFKYFKQQPT